MGRSTLSLALLAVLAVACAAPSLVSATSYSTTIAEHLVDISGATYCDAAQLADWSCAFCEQEPNFVLTGSYINKTTNMQIIVGYSPDIEAVVLAFKGTTSSSLTNWIEDLSFAFYKTTCPGCAVHTGFYKTYESVRPQALALLQTAIAAHPSAKIAITGHSLGGALANVAAIDLATTASITADIVYTYGQPRVGNPAYADFYTSTLPSAASYRVTHGADPVPHLPLRAMGFQHHANEVYYTPLNLLHWTCNSAESVLCADQWLIAIDVMDHLTYLSSKFYTRSSACSTWAKEHSTGILEVVDPNNSTAKASVISF